MRLIVIVLPLPTKSDSVMRRLVAIKALISLLIRASNRHDSLISKFSCRGSRDGMTTMETGHPAQL
jgi:hypothetical protein